MASDMSASSSSKELTDSQEEENVNEKKKAKNDISGLCPFRPLWSFGINSEVPLIDLTTENRTIVAYACSHIVIIYNYVSKEAIALQGHKNIIKTLSISKDGKWLLSADFKEESAVVVWDTESGVPICTLFNPHGENQITGAKISPNAKYIVTVGNESHQKVCFWLWTYGKDEPDDSVELIEIAQNRVHEIAFNEEFPEEFALTADHTVVFVIWENSKLKYYYPKIFGDVRRYGHFNCSYYVPKVQLALTATANGYILIWNVIIEKEHNKISSGERKHIKSIRLQKCSITVILHHDGMIVTGNSEGRVNFYDLEFKILYWCHNCGLDSIRSICFGLQSKLLAPALTVSEDEFDTDEEDDLEYEDEFGEYSESTQSTVCNERIEYLERIEAKTFQTQKKVCSTVSVNLEHLFREHDENKESFVKSPHTAVDATFESNTFYVDNFFVSTSSGAVALIKVSALKCQFILQSVGASVTSLDAHPRSDYIVTGNAHGVMCLYNYEKRRRLVRRKIPVPPDFNLLLNDQAKTGKIIYITCPQVHEKFTIITVLKYSPLGDILACGIENGTLWMLHPVTLEPLDDLPYKHSTESITKLIFTECGKYMAYSDNTFVVALFKRNHEFLRGSYVWDFLGKYRSHWATITDILFEQAHSDASVLRFFSLGEDQYLIEYDLNKSGEYPDPGLVISEITKIEYTAIPLCLSWYPDAGSETFLMISNSEYKYRLLNDTTKMIRGTFLGPIFETPVRDFRVLTNSEFKSSKYIVFITDKEIGLQIIPFDGNPYKILGITGHPQKISNVSVSHDRNILFTSGYNDSCVLMWKIKYKSVDVLARLGGEGLAPYYCLIDGGRKGWLLKEMIDLFYYAQILHQGENTTATRIVTEKVSTKQIPNIMRAVGYYPSNEEIEILMGEISYKNYAETGQLVEEITFEDFVKLYINHRPVYEISLNKLREAFQIFKNPNRIPFLDEENPVLTRNQFTNILLGKAVEKSSGESSTAFGEPLTRQEAYMYLKFLTGFVDNLNEIYSRNDDSTFTDFTFLPERISYKDFTADIMGIELPEETRADDE